MAPAARLLLVLLLGRGCGAPDAPGRALQAPPPQPPKKPLVLSDVAPAILDADAAGKTNPGARPLGQLNDHAGHQRGATPPAAAAAAPAPAKGATARVAIIIVGLLREFLLPKVAGTQHFLTDTLAAEWGRGGVDLYLCVDAPHAKQLRTRPVGALRPRAVFEHTFEGRHNQWPRMAACLDDVQRSAGERWGGYEWVVRSRFDNIFFAPVPPLAPLRTDTVYTRARRFGGYSDIDDEALSWWDYRGRGRAGAVCGPEEEGMPCAWRDLGTVAPPSASCVLVDDQFAYIPRQLVSTTLCRSLESRSRGRGLCRA